MLLAITIGDVSGVGPELLWRSLDQLHRGGPFVVYGDAAVLEAARCSLAERCPELATSHVVPLSSVPIGSTRWSANTMPVVQVDPEALCGPLPAGCSPELPVSGEPYPWGRQSPAIARLQMAALRAAVRDALAGRVQAVLTAPWDKAALADAGLAPTGHTEVLAELCGAGDVLMVLAGAVLRVALVTAHVPLREVPDLLDESRIKQAARLLARGLIEDFGIARPRIAVCGLNPHAGERGVLGEEDERIITPAVAALRQEGLEITGPWPADTLFPRVVHGAMPADGVLAMYHDQGLVALKTAHFGRSANITFGLPFVRTSVDHGTAADIAGRCIADAGSLLYAADLARKLAAHRGRHTAPNR